MAVLHRYFPGTEAPEYIGPAEGLTMTNVTNVAAGINGAVPDHSDVTTQGRESYPFFAAVIKAAVGAVGDR